MDKHTGKVRFGVVGTNFITDWVIAGARQDERFELAAVCSRKQETADAFAAKHQIPHTFTSLEEMAKSPLVDAVYIASPNFLHAEQSILCMKHGKHVLCEKPFASNAREAGEMIAASRTYNVTLMEAMKPTLTPNFLSVRENLGRLGIVRRYFSSYCQYSSRYDKFKEGIVLNAFKPELSNGAMMDIGIYTVYPMVVLFGRPDKIDASGIVLSSGADGQGHFTHTEGHFPFVPIAVFIVLRFERTGYLIEVRVEFIPKANVLTQRNNTFKLYFLLFSTYRNGLCQLIILTGNIEYSLSAYNFLRVILDFHLDRYLLVGHITPARPGSSKVRAEIR